MSNPSLLSRLQYVLATTSTPDTPSPNALTKARILTFLSLNDYESHDTIVDKTFGEPNLPFASWLLLAMSVDP